MNLNPENQAPAKRCCVSLHHAIPIWAKACPLLLVIAVIAGFSLRAAPVPPLGGGNITRSNEFSRLALLRQLGAGIARVPFSHSAYWKADRPAPEQADAVLREAQKQWLQVIILFEYYTRGNEPLGGYDKWKRIGAAFAERFAPNSSWWVNKGVQSDPLPRLLLLLLPL